jgi:ribosomal protein L11 methyltransferase
MKIYCEVKIPLVPGTSAEIIIARLSYLNFDGFVEEEDHILAYCEKKGQSVAELEEVLRDNNCPVIAIKEIEDKNWNAIWESEYEAVRIADRVMVRAPFHKVEEGIEYDIVIEPKMSFGTAHHETTSLMLELILGLELKSKSVLDIGSGTGVLAILAWKKGASDILAIDNDEWAWRNALDNVKLNDAESIKVELGDASALNSLIFDIIFANINRNILIEDIPAYAKAMHRGATLLLSGFYEADLSQINDKCISCGLTLKESRTKNKWTAAVFTKE